MLQMHVPKNLLKFDVIFHDAYYNSTTTMAVRSSYVWPDHSVARTSSGVVASGDMCSVQSCGAHVDWLIGPVCHEEVCALLGSRSHSVWLSEPQTTRLMEPVNFRGL